MLETTQRDLPVPVTKAAALRYLAESVGHGYVLFQHGEVPLLKALALVEKFDDLYAVLATRGARDYARSKGRSCARLVMFPKDGDTSTMLFWLMATEGEGTLPAVGNTYDARVPGARLSWGDQYELVSRPVRRRTGELRYIWTWVLTESSYRGWQDRLRTAAGRVRSSKERKPDFLVQQLEFLRKMPGFNGINRQKRALILGAEIPAEFHTSLNLRTLGGVVGKKLAVFSEDRTVRALAST
jgi:hypothetical protein